MRSSLRSEVPLIQRKILELDIGKKASAYIVRDFKIDTYMKNSLSNIQL